MEMLQVQVIVHPLQGQQGQVVLVVQEQLQEFQDHVFKEVVVEVVEHNMDLQHLVVLEVVEQVVQVKQYFVHLLALQQVQPILVAVEVVVKTCQTLLQEVVVEWLLLEDQVQ